MRLSAKHRRFVEEYLIDLNATQAAIRAGYSENTAGSVGSALLQREDVQRHLQNCQLSRSYRTGITQDQVLRELARIGFADIKQFLSFRTALTRIGFDKDGNEIIDYATVIELKDSDVVDGAPISEVSLKDGNLKFKLHDKVAALEKIGRHLGMFNDSLKLKGDADQPLQVTFNIPRPPAKE